MLCPQINWSRWLHQRTLHDCWVSEILLDIFSLEVRFVTSCSFCYVQCSVMCLFGYLLVCEGHVSSWWQPANVILPSVLVWLKARWDLLMMITPVSYCAIVSWAHHSQKPVWGGCFLLLFAEVNKYGGSDRLFFHPSLHQPLPPSTICFCFERSESATEADGIL